MPNLINIDAAYNNEAAVENVIEYVTKYGYASGCGVTSIAHAAEQMMLVKNIYGNNGDRMMRHFVISFDRQESQLLDADDLYRIGADLATQIGLKYQIVFGVHRNTECLHLHFGMNTVSYLNGLKVAHEHTFLAEVKGYANYILAEYGMEINRIEWNSVAWVDYAEANAKKCVIQY